jgi:hypothetical protein
MQAQVRSSGRGAAKEDTQSGPAPALLAGVPAWSRRCATLSVVFAAVGCGWLTLVPPEAGASRIVPPKVLSKFNGVYDKSTAPPSPAIAASPSQILEIVNSRYRISNRSGAGTTGSVSDLAGATGTFLSDPQVFWDPSTNRFYFSLFENRGTSGPDEGLVWGFSKTSMPSSAADFCSYFSGFNYGSTSIPDRQSLGDTTDFLLISSDRFSTANSAFLGTDVAWITKPGAGSTCPAQSSFKSGIQSLKNPDGSTPYGPTAARQVDSSATGWIVVTPSYASASSLTQFKVTRKPDGSAVIAPPVSVSVPAYSAPPVAPQAGTTTTGEAARPLQTRIYFTQAYMAYDPRLEHNVVWTAHTTAGGAGSEVRWYEINPAMNITDQSGTVSDPSLYVFNGTIAPDRLVSGSAALFGSNAVLTMNTSSATTDTAIQLVSKRGGAPQSALKKVKRSPGPDVDFTCTQTTSSYCRWGDYSGTAPDPGAPTTGSAGQVWQANQWNVASKTDSDVDWRTLVAAVQP